MATLVTESGRRAPARLAGSAILSVQSDDRLVELVRDGHERAFDTLVERYRKPLVRYAGRILPESRAEDAVQQAFMNAHSALVSSDEPVQLKAWLYTITRNASLNLLRQNGWNYEQIPADFDGVLRPDQAVEQKIQLERAVAAVNELPGRQRDAIVMREFEGRSYDEIARALGANDGAVRQLLNRARGTLRTVATAVMPPPIVIRAAASLPPSDGRRAAEVLGSLGAAGAMKLGATAVVAGSLVVGAVKAPLPLTDHRASHQKATISEVSAAQAASVSTRTSGFPTHVSHRGSARHELAREEGTSRKHGERTRTETRSGHTPAVSRGDDHGGASERGDDHGGSGTTTTRSGSDDGTRSGSDDSSRSGSSGGSGSGSSGSDDRATSGSGSSGSGTSGGGGSDDTIAASTPTTESTSGSGTSGGGTDDSVSTTSGSSGSGTSGSSTDSSGGSGTSGSGSHSGTDD